MTDADIIHWVAMIGFAASILDVVIPPNDIPILKQIKQVISLIALNVGHSHNMAPSKAAKEAQTP